MYTEFMPSRLSICFTKKEGKYSQYIQRKRSAVYQADLVTNRNFSKSRFVMFDVIFSMFCAHRYNNSSFQDAQLLYLSQFILCLSFEFIRNYTNLAILTTRIT